MSKLSKRLIGLEAGRPGGYRLKMSAISWHPSFLAFQLHSFPASQHANQLTLERLGLVDQHNRDIIPNFIA
jgi:hypothetical protein